MGTFKLRLLYIPFFINLFLTPSLFLQAQSIQRENTTEKSDTTKVENKENTLFETINFGRFATNAKNKFEIENREAVFKNSADRDTSYLNIGGAVRYNYVFTDYENGTSSLGTPNRNEWTWDTWRLNVDGLSKGVEFSFEYRFYPAFNSHFIHHGWFGYKFGNDYELRLGVQQVPFGMQKFVSHSWWFQLPYYVGFEDDYDMGFKIKRTEENWDFTLAYYTNSEPRGTSEASFGAFSAARYSYDIIAVDGISNIERNQFNARIAHKFGYGEIGLSGQFNEVFNLETENTGQQISTAFHLDLNRNNWNLKSEFIYYNITDVEDDDGNPLDVVQMGAFGFGSYDVANEAAMYMLGVSYTQTLDFGPISSITFYNDYSLMQKFGTFEFQGGRQPFNKSQQNVLGALITAANRIYTYVDLAMGYNHPWLTDNFGGTSLGAGKGVDFRSPITTTNPVDSTPGWNFRFNINLGYYF